MEAVAPTKQVRAGSWALSIFAYSLNATALRAHADAKADAHADGTLRWNDLSDAIGWAPQTSLRLAVANLCEMGVLAKVKLPGPPRRMATELTPVGRDLLLVADRLERWLRLAPGGPIALESTAAIGAIRALIAGWDALVVRKLAERSLTLTELNAEIDHFSYPTLERRLSRLRTANLVTALPSSGKGKPHEPTDWLRHAIAPLAAAGRWERLHMAGKTEPISPIEVESSFLLTLPLAKLPVEAAGDCALVVLTSADTSDGEEEREVAGMTLGVRRGTIVSSRPTASSNPTTWALGTPDEWLGAVIDGHFESLRIKGVNPKLPLHIVRGIHNAVFSPPPQRGLG